ncbi:phosphatase PAP2 family protein [Sphingomonas oryzagri]
MPDHMQHPIFDHSGDSLLPPPLEDAMSVSRLAFVKREARLIMAFIVVAIALLVVIRLGSEIREDGTSEFDRWILLSLRQPGNLGAPIGPTWLQPVFLDITALGGVTALTLLTVSVVGYLLAAKRWITAALIAAATISGSLIGQILKTGFARARPTIVPHFVEIHSLSYPSGHATNSAVVFLTLGALLARAQTARSTQIYIVTAAMLFTVMIGCSRVYNGVHWPTDVIAGWAIGGSWALLWWAIALRVQRNSRAGLSDRERQI